MHAGFVPLHVHSQYSLLDGAIRLDDLLEAAARFRMPAVAVTDHGNLFGAVEFFGKARKAGIKAIIGCEVYVSPTTRFDRTADEMHHLVLLVRDADGYRNLCRLVTLSYLEGFYRKPRIDKDLLAQYSGGLIGLTACLKGEVPSLLLRGRADEARRAALRYKNILGPDNFFLEIQKNGIPEQEQVNAMLIELSEELHIPLVATNDCHYLEKEDARAHDALVCIQTGKTLRDETRLKFTGEEFYLRSPEEMAEAFAHVPEAIANTRRIAERCNFEFDIGKTFHLPQYDVPPGETLSSFLRKLAEDGLRKRFGSAPVPPGHLDRLNFELGVIDQMGFPGYFLIVWDFIHYAREKGIPVGPGRGSAAGSLVAWCLGITELDPIKYNLLFERFLNPERISMPDMDIDFCKERRGEVIEYVTRKYGEDRVCQIITFGTMAARAVIRDVGRVLGLAYAEVDKVAKLVPEQLKIKLKDALAQEPRLKERYAEDESIQELFQIAFKLEGLSRNASTHAAGVVIAPEPLTNFLPLYRQPDREGVVTQFDMKAVEQLGLLKFDFLGLKTLTMIDRVEKMLNRRGPGEGMGYENGVFSVSRLPLDDPKTYELLSSGQASGIFQLESSGMREILVRLRPEVFEDLIALVALYRPGPLGSGMVDDFIKRKRGVTKVEYDLPELEGILKSTYGVILYQEQVMQIANVLAGFTLGQADALRKAMGKKIAELVEKQREPFMKGCRKNRVPEKKAEKLFELMAKFGEYGFNKSHSAAYALITYQTAWLKAHYPVEFMCALLSADMDNTDKVVKYINDCREMGIPVRPPDVNLSGREFTVVEGAIRFGLEGVKGVGGAAIESILEARQEGPFKSLTDFCSRADLQKVNRKVIESLILAGAFDSLGYHRAQIMAMVDRAIEEGRRVQGTRRAGLVGLFDDEPVVETRPEIPAWDDKTLLKHEKEALGFYITGHPLSKYAQALKRFVSTEIAGLSNFQDRETVAVGGVVAAVKSILTKKGDRMASIVLEDLTGSVEVIIFPNLYAEASRLLDSDAPLLVEGHVDRTDTGFKIVAQKVSALGNLQARKVELRLNAAVLSEDDLRQIKAVLGRYEGSCPVTLRLGIPSVWEMVLACRIATQPSMDMIRELESVLGQETVHLVGSEA